MRGTPPQFFTLSLEARKALIKTVSTHISMNDVPLHELNDASSFLEHLRAHMLSEILGKYKVF